MVEMQEPPIGFVHKGLICYQDSEDPFRFWYLAEKPAPSTGMARPGFIDRGQESSFLTMEAEWLPAADAVKTLKEEIARRHPELDIDLVETSLASPAQVRVESMTLDLADGEGRLTELARSTTTRMPPWRAALSATVAPAQAEGVRQALGGTENRLFLTLSYALAVQGCATAEVSGDVPLPAAGQAGGDEASAEAQAETALNAALAAGTLTAGVVTVPACGAGAVPLAELAERTLASAMAHARSLLAAEIRRPAVRPGLPRSVPVSVQESESGPLRIPATGWLTATSDLSAWAGAWAAAR